MKNGAYLIFESINLDKPNGIEKKIILQLDAFRGAGFDMRFVELQKSGNTFWNAPEKLSQFDFIYFRKETTVEWTFIRFFKKVKEQNPRVVIFMDIPTFPYDGEFSNSLRGFLTLKIDHFFRKRLYKVLDRVILTGVKNYNYFCKTPALTITNGIDLSSVPQRHHVTSESIIIGCVGKLSPWHGYERLIEGLHSYKTSGGKRNIHLLIVGDGPEREMYEELVRKYDLTESVTFTGFLCGEQLEEAYNLMDIGCCSLGRYKSKLDKIGDLKSRDYLARGIPIITGCIIDILENKPFKYSISFSNDSSPVDCGRIIEFYDSILKGNEKNIEHEIKQQMNEVIDFKSTYAIVPQTALEIIGD